MPDWFYRTVARPLLFRLPVPAARRCALGLVGSLARLPLGPAVIDFLGHMRPDPRLRRVTSPVDQHPDYWAYARDSVLGDIAADLVGPDVKFHHSKLNFKWAAGGAEVKWHQDIQYWPHTNYSPLTMGVYLHDCGGWARQAP